MLVLTKKFKNIHFEKWRILLITSYYYAQKREASANVNTWRYVTDATLGKGLVRGAFSWLNPTWWSFNSHHAWLDLPKSNRSKTSTCSCTSLS